MPATQLGILIERCKDDKSIYSYKTRSHKRGDKTQETSPSLKELWTWQAEIKTKRLDETGGLNRGRANREKDKRKTPNRTPQDNGEATTTYCSAEQQTPSRKHR
eukprot:GHVT01020650.1.p3 GENE.GHVT01020650.1~~GHVT01020650.1.p3  ORF type:complete len:104 (+),score=12.49 GHVT01020650.1:805-1116(+)